MFYEVQIKKKLLRDIKKLPNNIQECFYILVKDLKEKGPIQKKWPNFSSLKNNKYHCHLKHSWVACWEYEKQTIIIEVYYVGSRENAPY